MANLADLARPLLPTQPTLFATASGSLQNASTWYNLTAWTANVTRYAPSLEDIVWAGPRIFRKLGSFITLTDSLTPNGHYIHEATETNIPHSLAAAAAAAAAEPSLYNIMDTASHASGETDSIIRGTRLSMDGARGLGSVFSYATSKWAFSCIAMAVVLNRTHIFAATRRRLRLRWQTRVLLRIIPVLLLLLQARRLLQSIQCQTASDFGLLRWGIQPRVLNLCSRTKIDY